MKLHYGLDDLAHIDWGIVLPIIIPIFLVVALLNLLALIDIYRHRNTREHMLIWIFIILLVNPLGSIFYFIIGRKDRVRD